MKFTRNFSSNEGPYAGIEFETRRVELKDSTGKTLQSFDSVTVPSFWSQSATDILATKFFKRISKDRTEDSLTQVIDRIVHTITGYGEKLGYFTDIESSDAFADDLKWLLVHQHGAFNSPVWFNCGLNQAYGHKGAGGHWYWNPDTKKTEKCEDAYTHPQCSACFIQSVPDTLSGIYDLVKSEAMLFKHGSGSGTNYSTLRARGEPLSTGGTSSGVMSFLRVLDRSAGATKSGGTNRRAARMNVLDVDHPEIEDFIAWKSKEEKKAQTLIAAGYSSDFNGEAYDTISGQNSNNSVSISDAFMQAVEQDLDWHLINRKDGAVNRTIKARGLFRLIAQAAWECADPGVQFIDTMNRAFPVKTHKVRASNPCAPKRDRVLTPTGISTIGDIQVGDTIWSGKQWTKVKRKVCTGVKPVFRYSTAAGIIDLTACHQVFQNAKRVEVGKAKAIDRCVGPKFTGPGNNQKQSDQKFSLFNAEVCGSLLPEVINDSSLPECVTTLRRCFTERAKVLRKGISFTTTCQELAVVAQQMLSALGIRSIRNALKKKPGNYELMIMSDVDIFETIVGFDEGSAKSTQLKQMLQAMAPFAPSTYFPLPNKACKITEREFLGEEEVWDIEVEAEEHSFWCNGLLISNCSEFIHPDDSACNLASLNLVKFLGPDGKFDFERFRNAIRIFITAQDILVDLSSYPTKKIAQNSHKFRPLGLGYANLGALLMRKGLPYDSKEGRLLAKQITESMSAMAWDTSFELSKQLGTSKVLRENEKHFHDGSFYDCAPRNSQVTLLAPTGTIGFIMDCDTTGIEPDFALRKHKKLAGGGDMMIENQSVLPALKTLGYSAQQLIDIIEFICETGGVGVGCPHLTDDHKKVFACASDCSGTGSAISASGHLEMMKAVQPYLSGAISKTVNLPNSATVEDIEKIYFDAWKSGLKCVALYRDGCKSSQPLNAVTDGKKGPEAPPQTPQEPTRKKLPSKRKGWTQHFRIGGTKVYLTTGEYDDGSLGEIFITLNKQGTTLGALLDNFAKSISVSLQYGVPLAELADHFTLTNFEPAGPVTGHTNVKLANSIIDAIFRILQVEYLKDDALAQVKLTPANSDQSASEEPAVKVPQYSSDAPLCSQCGHITIRNGTCFKCLNCGTSLGCS